MFQSFFTLEGEKDTDSSEKLQVTLFVERERLSEEKKHLVRKGLARVTAVEVDGLFGIQKE